MSLASRCADLVALNLWHPVGAVVELTPGTVYETHLLEESVSHGVSVDGGREVAATECEFFQPLGALNADGGMLMGYVYRVPHPYCVIPADT